MKYLVIIIAFGLTACANVPPPTATYNYNFTSKASDKKLLADAELCNNHERASMAAKCMTKRGHTLVGLDVAE